MNNKILGMLKIAENGLCSDSTEFNLGRKKFDDQIVAGFFYALNRFTSDFLGEHPLELKTANFKIIFHPKNEKLYVYIVNEDFKEDTLILETKRNELLEYFVTEMPNTT